MLMYVENGLHDHMSQLVCTYIYIALYITRIKVIVFKALSYDVAWPTSAV